MAIVRITVISCRSSVLIHTSAPLIVVGTRRGRVQIVLVDETADL